MRFVISGDEDERPVKLVFLAYVFQVSLIVNGVVVFGVALGDDDNFFGWEVKPVEDIFFGVL